ncbi:LETM1 domain-containing protein 1-like isoform X1 [Daphnia pulex]|uniref:LETM1 domain-containing protein 1-like isoform X1 n=1 Tax=Daphnia pulex TaxID=6669 RepID=UPI001EE029B7|nr:LETM1 domain-containing protein 1-like isoform X1 [Daphnia pulex]
MFPNNRRILSCVRIAPYVCFRNASNEGVVKKKVQEVGHKVSKEIKSYALTKYVDYVRNYDKILEVRFPRAMKVYRVFSVGIKDLYQDTKTFVKVKSLIRNAKKNGGGIHSVGLKEIDIFYRMPREMLKVSPVLLISALPFANYIIFPLAYVLPKQLLSTHFWSLQQRRDFALQDHKKSVQHFRPTFRCMQARIPSVNDTDLTKKLSQMLSKLASGVHPTVEEILEVKILFQREPFHLNCLYPRHKNQLLKVHGMHTLWSRRRRLSQRAEEILNKDKVLEREGVTSLSLEELRSACYSRGLNPSNMRTEDMVKYLEQWIAVSVHVDPATYSLVLHCPILLAYNQPTNRVLIQ